MHFFQNRVVFAFQQPASPEWITTYDQTILVAKGETARAVYRRILREYASFAASLPGMDHEFVPAQLTSTVEERYGKPGAETILSNTSTRVVLPGVGQREAEFYTQRIGKTKITTWSRSRRGTWEVSSHRGEAARWLIEPHEIRTLPARQALVLADVTAPLLVRVKPYYRSRRLARRANLPLRQHPKADSAQPPLKRLPAPTSPSGTGGLSPD